MRTVQLSDQGVAEIEAALVEKGRGLEMLIDLLSARHGPESDSVKMERGNLARLYEAARELQGETR